MKTNAKDYLGKEVSIEIDRPLGTRHPKKRVYVYDKLWLHSKHSKWRR